MKTNRKIIFCVALVLCLAIFAGCNLNLSQITSIQLVNTPQTTFVKNEASGAEETELKKFVIRVNNNDGTFKDYTYDDAKIAGLVIENFSLKTVGIFQATINFQGFKVYFDYQVIDGNESGFAGGDGSEKTPYLISTAAHWNNIDAALKANKDNCYFELTNDIDFKDVVINQIGYANSFNGASDNILNKLKELAGEGTCYKHTGSGYDCIFRKIILDGKNYSLRNIDTVSTMTINNEPQNPKYIGLMNTAYGSEIKNLNIYFASESENKAHAFVYIPEYIENEATDKYSLTFENVNTYGYINTIGSTTGSSVAGFVANVKNGSSGSVDHLASVKFTNCNNYTNILGGAGASCSAGFIAQAYNAKISFDTCKNYGNIEGAPNNAGFLGAYTGKDVFSTCKNYGTITKINENGAVIYGNGLKQTPDEVEKYIKTLTQMKAENGTIDENSIPTGTASLYMVLTFQKTGTGSAFTITKEIVGNKYYIATGIRLKSESDNIDNAVEFKAGTEVYLIGTDFVLAKDNQYGLSAFYGTPSYYIYAYDANGILIGLAKVF